ncbi:MAG: hypothetical protein Pg6A_03380 [Termitinemataceae bacterium]|nr:MAG: hypothetical protein Pg6A_03380 [Termitinemataceae bacterium]
MLQPGKIKIAIMDIPLLKGVSLRTMPLLLAMSAGLVMVYIRTVDTRLTNFYERAIGHASINGVDAPIRVTAFWTCIAIFALSFLLGSYVISRIKGWLLAKFPETSFGFEYAFLFELGMLLFINELIFLDSNKQVRSEKTPVLILCFVFAALCLHWVLSLYKAYRNRARNKNFAETPLQTALAFILPIPLVYFTLLFTSSGQTIAVISIKAAIIYFALYGITRFLAGWKINSNAAAYSLVPLSFLPAVYIIANEAQYTLTKHGIVLAPKAIALCIGVFLVAVAVIVYFLKLRADNDKLAMNKIENIVVPVLLVSLGLFASHVQTIEANFDLLHNGNATLPVQQLFQFGNLPFFDIWPHQHLPVLSYFYVLFNGLNFLEPNIWLGMSDAIVYILICYFVLRLFISARWAALLMLFTPILSYANIYYITGLLPLLYLKKMREKRRIIDYAVFFGLGLVALVYQSTSGKIAVIAAVVLIALSCSSKKNIFDAVKVVAIMTGVPVVIYASYVVFQGENLFDRLSLISALGGSDILVGSYSTLFSNNRTKFEILMYYGFFPMLGVLSAIFALKDKEKTNLNYGIVFIVVACLICSLRALARHSLVEGLQTDFYPLLFVIVPCIFVKNKVTEKTLTALVMVFFVLTPYVSSGWGIAARGIKNYTFKQFEAGDVRIDTVNNQSYPKNLRKVLDAVLTKDQTFFETQNAYLLYALMERDCTFLDSSTLLIQYERPQVAYIHTIEKLYEQNKVPIIITGQSAWGGAAIDDIPSELSLFKLEEWIYAHYEPWIWVDGFHLWRARNSGIELPENFKTADVPFEYEKKDYIQQNFDMIKLPYVWGNYDKKVNRHFPQEQQRVADKLALEAEAPVTLQLDPNIDKSGGNYIYFRINAAAPGNLTLEYGNGITNSCIFDIVAGEWKYLVRISSQYNWVNEPQSQMIIQSSVPVTVEQVSVLKGD